MSLSRCPVCDFAELRADEVENRGTLRLVECPRCEHRATRAVPSLPSVPVRMRRAESGTDEEATAAA